jgi:hypothetical protein
VHFDAKYKIDNIADILSDRENRDLDEEKIENRKGVYKNADLLKMHAYKDAIRRTGGAYVLYPGNKSINQKGFHEIIPGLGAFPVRPSTDNSGIDELKSFILEIVDHFVNRASQREKLSFHTYDVHKNSNPTNLNAKLPEPYGKNRDLIPDNVNVIVGYFHRENLDWILQKQLYNIRDDSHFKTIGNALSTAKFLLLHTSGETSSDRLFCITSDGPAVKTKEELSALGYINPRHNYYYVYEVDPAKDSAFAGQSWDLEKLLGAEIPTKPVIVSLTELMKSAI